MLSFSIQPAQQALQPVRVSNMPKKRNYKKEYANQGASKKQKQQRARNNKANRDSGTYGNGDGMDVAHKDNNTNNQKKSNLKKQAPSKNRSFKRTKKAKRK